MATILKNNIKPGGSTLKGLVATDASGNKRDVKFVRQVNGSGTATTVYDTFKEYAYGDVTINSFSYGDIPANGTAITPSALTYSQVRTEVGHSGAKYGTATLTSGATVTYSGTGVNATTGAIGATKLSAADKVRTKITTVTVTVTLNGKSASKTFDVYQQANAITAYSDLTGTLSLSVGDIAASGGTKKTTDVTATKSLSQTVTYTSGATRAGSISYGAVTGADVSANSLTSTEKARTAIKSNAFSITATGEGNKTKTAYATVYQAANAFTGYTYDAPTGLSITCGVVPAGGGSVTSGTVSGTCSQVRRYNYTAGNDQKRDTINPTYTGAWSGGASNIGSRGSTVDTANTSTGKTLTYTYTANSKSNTATCTVYQQRNVADASSKITAYGNVTCSASVGDIPAGGGTVTVSRSASQTRTRQYYYTSGTAGRTASEACTITWNTTDVTATATGLKTTEKARTAIKTFNYTATGEGSKSNTCSCTAYQAANVRTKNAGAYKSYGTPTISIGSGLTAGGGSATVTASVTDVKYYYYTYTDTSANEGTTAHYENVAGSVSLSIVSQTASRYSLSGTTLSHSKMGTTTGDDSVTVRATNTRSTSLTKDTTTKVTNTQTKNTGAMRSYGTPTVSIGTGITAAGGTATVSHGVTNTRYYYYTYTDTSANEGVTAHYENVTGTTTISITSNGNNRFSLSGNTLSHTGMGASATTDSCTITAKNSNDTSKTATATTSATNAAGTQHYKNTSGTTGDNWTYGTPSNPTLTSALKANGGTVTCSGSTVKNTKTYYLKYTSGSYGSLITETPSGTVAYEISSNGNSRFAFASGSNTTINHSNMTTNATTDTVGVKAYNTSDSTKKSAQVTASVTNSYSDAWNNPSVSAFGYATSSFAYSGGTSAAPNSKTASQSGTRTFTSGSTSTISNSTFTWTYSTSSTGFTVNSSTGVVTAAANNGAARSGVITATATGSGSKSGTKTFTFSQAKDPTNGYTFVDLKLPSGLKWAYLQIGEPYQWGSSATYSSSSSQYYSGTTMDDAHDTARQKWGGEWRMPTKAEFQELVNNTTNTFTTDSYGNPYRLFTSKNNSKTVDLLAAGYKHFRDGTQTNTNTGGMYWTRTGNSEVFAYALMFTKTSIDSAMSDGYNKKYGAYIKPVIVA